MKILGYDKISWDIMGKFGKATFKTAQPLKKVLTFASSIRQRSARVEASGSGYEEQQK